ncbi:MAG TPA: FAD:protein FMN transferase [Kiritimatiellae bacterium]|nr:FAD:protein FMN transferase [Kiritimatiellia bacterium]
MACRKNSRRRFRRLAATALVLLILGLVATVRMGSPAGDGRDSLIVGETMGTTFHIRILPHASPRLMRRVGRALDRLEDIFSTFRPASVVSRFNDFRGPGSFRVPPEMVEVVDFALYLARLSGGAYDPTIAPVVNLWGFGWEARRGKFPDRDAVGRALRATGYSKVRVFRPGRLVKEEPRVRLDLASVAKGYAVDYIWKLLRGEGYTDFLVEIGGEVRVSGTYSGRVWRVGIEAPLSDRLPGEEVLRVLGLADGTAAATSGSYRNFVTSREGQAYGHVIDARTGFPVSNGVVSVTVVAPRCLAADGLATALMVLGPDKGLALARKFPHTEALMALNTGSGFRVVQTEGFASLVQDGPAVPYAMSGMEAADRRKGWRPADGRGNIR